MDTRSTPKGTVTIRPAIAEDAARLHSLRLEALTNHPEAFTADAAEAAANPPEVWSELVEKYASTKDGTLFVAEAGDQLVGMTGLFRGRYPKTRHSGKIWGVYVASDWRGMRIAQDMIEGCIGWAQANTLAVLTISVVATNTAAIRCYDRCGFKVYGIEPRAALVDGVFYDELLMAISPLA